MINFFNVLHQLLTLLLAHTYPTAHLVCNVTRHKLDIKLGVVQDTCRIDVFRNILSGGRHP